MSSLEINTSRGSAVNTGLQADPIQSRLDNFPLSKVHYYIWAICTIGFILDVMDLFLVSFALPMIIKEWKVSSEVAGLIASGSMWGMVIGAYAWGILGDRIGRRGTMQATILTYSLITGLCALSWNSITLFIGRFLVGIGLGGFFPVDYAVLVEFIPAKSRGRLMAYSILTMPIGILLGSLIAYNLGPTWGWRALFVIGALPAFLAFLARRVIPESPRYLVSKGKYEEADKVVRWLEEKSGVQTPATTDIKTYTVKQEAEKVNILELFTSGYVVRTLFTWLLWLTQSLPYFAMGTMLPTLLIKHYGLPQQEAIKFVSYLTIVAIGGRALAAFLIESVGRKKVLILFSLLAAIGLAMYNGAETVRQIFIVAVIACFFYEGTWTSVMLYTAELFPTRLRSTGAGSAQAVGRIASGISPIFVGFMMARSVSTIFYAFAGCFLLMTILVIFFGIETKGRPLEEISK
ncbi:MFS transporter [Pelotomaculum propionicicum]|uniref:Putative niacin/nicotinamide transporter NaiP n=1 Tax=Pelotomaculum propionicicum TaxID=258475 RepID=A0A4Y7RIZ9_9FIRM|nr:MFS transporter [Pelotomaculum propionicicum]NLI11340.1 MFS transporter [Peptococcaceae bacterium]TEB08965.1 putative niacin/nicotinamide transporter NaiP [Pelotomaculum propionicicum]